MTVLEGLNPEISKCGFGNLGMGAGVRRMKKPLPLIRFQGDPSLGQLVQTLLFHQGTYDGFIDTTGIS